jgi:aldehyde dehydrogenase (NAD+)
MDILKVFDTMPYGPAPESQAAAIAWLEEHERKYGLFIDNTWKFPKDAQYYPSMNPATGEKLADSVQAGQEDVDEAVASARQAFEDWSHTPGSVRARYLYAIARNIQKHHALLALLESMDNGKPLRESRDIDVPLLARYFYYHAGWAQLSETELRDYQPVGVVGQIIPWNFPLLSLGWKVAPALAMGNTVVLKSNSFTRLSALLFAEVITEAGLPPGVVNILTGDNNVDEMIVTHPDIDKIAFSGTIEEGRTLRRQMAGSGKRLSLQLSGKSPFIVFDDADLDSAIEGVVDSIWLNQGQTQFAGSRLLLQENVADDFISKLKIRMGKLRVGDPLDKCIDIGAIVDQSHWEAIDRWVQTGIKEGGSLFQPDIRIPEGGCFYPPTLFTGLEPASEVAQEDILGPVLVCISFRSPAEAVELANNTRYGLAASIWSQSIDLALEVASKLKAGVIWVNSASLFDPASGFGGYRESGYGREGGKEGLFEYLRVIRKDRPHPKFKPSDADEDKPAWGDHTPSQLTMPIEGWEDKKGIPRIYRTPKMYIGGKQVLPDRTYTYAVLSPSGEVVGMVGDGNRKDIRDAVEAAYAASMANPGWATSKGYKRSQYLYFIAENIYARRDDFVRRIMDMTGRSQTSAQAEVELAVEQLFTYAAWADKYGGSVQETTLRGVTIAVNEPVGVIGIACPDEFPLLAFVSLMAPAISRGNTVVIIPSMKYPLFVSDFYQVLDTSNVPPGVVNIVTGNCDHLMKTLIQHEAVDAVWYFGSEEGSYYVEHESAVNIKRSWVNYGIQPDWTDLKESSGHEFLYQSTEVKNIWIPTGG